MPPTPTTNNSRRSTRVSHTPARYTEDFEADIPLPPNPMFVKPDVPFDASLAASAAFPTVWPGENPPPRQKTYAEMAEEAERELEEEYKFAKSPADNGIDTMNGKESEMEFEEFAISPDTGIVTMKGNEGEMEYEEVLEYAISPNSGVGAMNSTFRALDIERNERGSVYKLDSPTWSSLSRVQRLILLKELTAHMSIIAAVIFLQLEDDEIHELKLFLSEEADREWLIDQAARDANAKGLAILQNGGTEEEYQASNAAALHAVRKLKRDGRWLILPADVVEIGQYLGGFQCQEELYAQGIDEAEMLEVPSLEVMEKVARRLERHKRTTATYDTLDFPRGWADDLFAIVYEDEDHEDTDEEGVVMEVLGVDPPLQPAPAAHPTTKTRTIDAVDKEAEYPDSKRLKNNTGDAKRSHKKKWLQQGGEKERDAVVLQMAPEKLQDALAASAQEKRTEKKSLIVKLKIGPKIVDYLEKKKSEEGGVGGGGGSGSSDNEEVREEVTTANFGVDGTTSTATASANSSPPPPEPTDAPSFPTSKSKEIPSPNTLANINMAQQVMNIVSPPKNSPPKNSPPKNLASQLYGGMVTNQFQNQYQPDYAPRTVHHQTMLNGYNAPRPPTPSYSNDMGMVRAVARPQNPVPAPRHLFHEKEASFQQSWPIPGLNVANFSNDSPTDAPSVRLAATLDAPKAQPQYQPQYQPRHRAPSTKQPSPLLKSPQKEDNALLNFVDDLAQSKKRKAPDEIVEHNGKKMKVTGVTVMGNGEVKVKMVQIIPGPNAGRALALAQAQAQAQAQARFRNQAQRRVEHGGKENMDMGMGMGWGSIFK